MDKIKELIPLNWALLANPYNWVVIFLMIAIAGLALAYILPSNSAPNVAEE